MADPVAQLDRVLRTAEANRDDDLADVLRLVAQPSISAQNIGVRECAALEESLLRKAGLETRVLETSAHPMVYGERLGAPGKPTVLFYPHYYVQPTIRAIPSPFARAPMHYLLI